MKVKQPKNKFLFFLALFSLLTIGLVTGVGFLRNRPKIENKLKEKADVLGQSIKDNFSESLTDSVNNYLQNTLQNTKEEVTEKAKEIEKTLVTTVEKEITDLTKSQIENLKVQICTDWGVINATPIEKP